MLGSFKWKEWLDGKSIFQNFVANLLLAVGASALFMLWSYLQGQSGPWMAITGIAASAAVLWLRHQLIVIRPRSRVSATPNPSAAELAAKISALEADKQAANIRADKAEQELALAKKRNLDTQALRRKRCNSSTNAGCTKGVQLR